MSCNGWGVTVRVGQWFKLTLWAICLNGYWYCIVIAMHIKLTVVVVVVVAMDLYPVQGE